MAHTSPSVPLPEGWALKKSQAPTPVPSFLHTFLSTCPWNTLCSPLLSHRGGQVVSMRPVKQGLWSQKTFLCLRTPGSSQRISGSLGSGSAIDTTGSSLAKEPLWLLSQCHPYPRAEHVQTGPAAWGSGKVGAEGIGNIRATGCVPHPHPHASGGPVFPSGPRSMFHTRPSARPDLSTPPSALQMVGVQTHPLGCLPDLCLWDPLTKRGQLVALRLCVADSAPVQTGWPFPTQGPQQSV